MTKETIHINVPALARVEGEGALTLDITGTEIRELELRIFEPPRYFEKILEGRDHKDIIDIVARICGICPVAYQVTAVQAIANAYHIVPDDMVRNYRRLFYCGEWIQSHSLHIHLLALPDFLGFKNVIDMSGMHPEVVHRGLRLQKAGNRIMEVLGGRSVHPVGLNVSGFYSYPDAAARANLKNVVTAAILDAEKLLEWVSMLELPDYQDNICFVSLSNGHSYPIEEGAIISSKGHYIEARDFEKYFIEQQVPYSTALHCLLEQDHYMVGPLARFKLNQHLLPDPIQEHISRLHISLADNSFQSLVARAIEILYALYEANRLLELCMDDPVRPAEYAFSDSTGYACTEAPRGLLWHKYELDRNGKVASARIVPPTSQNQGQIERDLRESLTRYGLNRKQDELRFYAEKIIRNYDPCISCATHFLHLDIKHPGTDSYPDVSVQNPDFTQKSYLSIIGVGSPVAGDNHLENIIEELKSHYSGQDHVVRNIIYLERPGLGLDEYLDKDAVNIVIDSLEPGSEVDGIQYREGSNINSYFSELQISSHEYGVLDTISLINKLYNDKIILIMGLPLMNESQTGSNSEIMTRLIALIEKTGELLQQ